MVDATIAQELRIFYVYVIFRPTGEPCYVGKGSGGRWQQHIKGSHNRHLKRLYEKSGFDLPVVIIRDHMSEFEAFEMEIALISVIGREQHGGSLFNLTDGGEGVRGHIRTREQTEAFRKSIIEKWADPDYKIRMIEQRKEKYLDPELRKRFAIMARTFWADDEAKERLLIKRNATLASPEARAAKSLKSKEVNSRPGYRAKQREAQLVAQNKPETRNKRSASNKAKWTDPEYRERVVASATIGMNRPEVKASRARTDASPETRKRRSDATTEAFSNPKFKSEWMTIRWTPERRAEQAERTRERNNMRKVRQGQSNGQLSFPLWDGRT